MPKTLLGSGITYAHYGKKCGMTSVIICPSHLVEKWKREVERFVPNAKGYIVENLSELIAIEPIIKNPIKKENSYIIISKEAAKFSYETRPAAVWSNVKKCFICPTCGQPLYKEVWVGTGRDKYKTTVYLKEEDFRKVVKTENSVCKNKVKVFNNATGKWDKVDCNSKLWTPVNKYEKTNWIKLGAEGWIMTSHIQSLYDNYYAKREVLDKKQQKFFACILEKKDQLDEGEKITSSTKGPRKYCISRYIRERYKGYIDYLIGDELHEYKSDSLQGQAFGDLAMAANKVIGLTGTLLNGYAEGLFYLLFRTMPEVMRKEGYDYNDVNKFQREYGVVKTTSEHNKSNRGGRGARTKTGSAKKQPGVSPLVFTKFLLEIAAFVSISDMAEGLPDYQEIPIAVDMDTELSNAYQDLEKDLRSVCGAYKAGGQKLLSQMLQTLSTYPDMPYDQAPILHPDSGETMCVPTNLPLGLRNKEEALLELVKEKIANGEKVLVYYEFTNKTDVADKITKALTDQGIRAINMTSGNVKAKEREAWVEKQLEKGLDVLLCNPNLVKTGLDLLEFTTIVFYQMGYNIFTMRQASRRSWRLSQTKDIEVYFMYYKNTIQEQAIALMASKLQASMALEGKFSEEGLRAMADNEDLLSKVASSVVEGIKYTVDAEVFTNKVDNSNPSSMATMVKVEHERKSIEQLLVEILIRQQLEYLDRKEYKQQPNKKTSKVISSIFNNKTSVSSLFRPYAC